jgi:hypothetical protein
MKYEEKFEMMANRGKPVGPIALLDRVQAPPAATRTPDGRRFRGLAVAAATFVVVLIGGLLLGWFRAPLDFITGTDGLINWTEIEGPARLVGGPGGIIRIDYDETAQSPVVEFSPDGREWTPTEGLTFDPRVGVREVLTSGATWLLLSTDNKTVVAQASTDGITWSKVDFPDALTNAFESIAGSPGGFMATTYDVFEPGSTFWWSSDGRLWADVTSTFPGDPREGQLWGSNGGILWSAANRFLATQFPLKMYVTNDGTNWTERTIDPAPGMLDARSDTYVQLVEHIGDQWIAILQINKVDADPDLVVWASVDGNEWRSLGVVPFGNRSGYAVSIDRSYIAPANAVEPHLIVAPFITPVDGASGEIRSFSGSSIGMGEVWMTSDGRTWHRELKIKGMIDSYAVTETGDGSLAGVWGRVPEFELVADAPDGTSPPVVMTTQFQPDAQDIDPVGQALQDSILADGTVTRDEFEQAADGWKTCMQGFGFDAADYEIYPSGGWSRGWSADPYEGDSQDALCNANYVARVLDGINP